MQQVNATGAQGFLKWLQQFQPAVYARIAPELPRKAPQLFSDFEAAGGVAGAAARGMAGLSDSSTDLGLQPIDLSAVDTMVAPTVDVADAANAGPVDSSSASWLSSLINGVSSAFMTVSQAQTQQQIVAAQLQRAQAGLPPLNITPGAAGVPQISVGTSSSTILWAGAAAVGLLALFMMKPRH